MRERGDEGKYFDSKIMRENDENTGKSADRTKERERERERMRRDINGGGGGGRVTGNSRHTGVR